MNERTKLLLNKNPNHLQIINKNQEDEAVRYVINII